MLNQQKKELKRRSSFQIMLQLVGLVTPLLHIMLLAIFLGVLGYLCAISLTILASQILITGLNISETAKEINLTALCIALLVVAFARGFLHYAEQYCNHFIAFKLLAMIRHKVFEALRRLCPAKLEGKDRGNLISIITTDIELLEVFYAHTISPIAIALITSFIMTAFIGHYHIYAGLFALCGYSIVGIIIPIWNGKIGAKQGMEFRTKFGELNSFVLDSLRGLDETIQYQYGEKRALEMEERSLSLGALQKELSSNEGKQRAITNFTILFFSFGMVAMTLFLYQLGELSLAGALTCIVAMMGSFGPTVALASLSNNLNQTLASGERVLSILEEKPVVEEITQVKEPTRKNPDDSMLAVVEKVSFSYDEQEIISNLDVAFKKGTMIGILGESGCGKSTLLKLLMRFWKANHGTIWVDGQDVNTMLTKDLRDTESYVTQETHLFHDSIANNIAIAKKNATRAEIIQAAKKASIHDFIDTLPNGYDTNVGELGDSLSGGEKQRIGVARAFLHDAPLMLLDEPTSNLDSLNEGIILKALSEECKNKKDKTVILVSHRKSTLKMMDSIIEMKA